MKKLKHLFFLIILLAFLIHVMILLFLFSKSFIATKKTQAKVKTVKPVTFEPVPTQLDLPNMMPDQSALTTPSEPTESILEKSTIPDLPDKYADKDSYLLTKTETKELIHELPQKKPSSRRFSQPKPTFNFENLNHYAVAEGNSIFKNHGQNRPVTKEDLAILMYQERVRKHFSVSMNRYADQTYFYNINRAAIDLIVVIGKDGRVLDLKTRNHSNNPALHNLMEKIIKYAGLFPTIPDKTNLQSFTLMTTVTISQGKLSSGYGWQ